MQKGKSRIFLISWLILPIVLVWLSTNYLIGLGKHPVWEKSEEEINASTADITKTESDQIDKIHWDGSGLITLWFDDAWTQQFTIAAPILEKNNQVGTLSVPTGMVGFENYMSWSQLEMLYKSGWEITSHTVH